VDGVDSKTAVEGTNVLLAALASYWTSERAPERLFTDTCSYAIRHTALRAGSIEYDFAVNIPANGVWDLIKFGFAVFVYEQFKAWIRGQISEIPGWRAESRSLMPGGPSIWPVIDLTE
jgi:hypothetical protein